MTEPSSPSDGSTRPAGAAHGALRAGAALVAAAPALVLLSAGPRLYDDAYITLRYAARWAAGDGLVYNAGERVLGTSAPAWALLLGLLGRLTGPERLPALAFALGALGLVATSLLLVALLGRSGGLALSLLATAAILSPLETARVFASGMETPLYLASLAAALLLLARRRHAAAFAIAGLLPFVHPEAVLLFPALAVAVRLREGRWPFRDALPGLLAGLAAGAVLLAWFGSPVPQSVGAKRAAFVQPTLRALGDLARAAAEVLLPPRAPVALEAWSPAAALVWESGAPLLSALLAGALALAGRKALARAEVAAAGLFATAYLLAFALANPLVFPWYAPPLVLALGVVVGALAAEAARGAGRDRAVGLAAAATFAIGTLLRAAALEPYDTSDREDLYRAAAARIDAAPSEVVLAPEIGALGFYSRARIWDAGGLVTPEALRFRDASWRAAEARFGSTAGGAVPPGAIEAVRPDWVVSLTQFLEPTIRARPGSLDGYSLVAEYPTRRWSSRAVVVWRRRP